MDQNLFTFDLIAEDPTTHARAGVLHTPHGDIETPIFMPVGTKANVKGIPTETVKQLGAQIVLANTYHLSMRPGEDTIAELIRGAFLEELDDELPHSLAVVVDSIERPEDNESGQSYEGKIQVMVSVYVERDSQKPIIIGRGAEHLVRVKKKLRTPVNRIVGGKAKLDLHVKVAKGWQSDPKQLERLGF